MITAEAKPDAKATHANAVNQVGGTIIGFRCKSWRDGIRWTATILGWRRVDRAGAVRSVHPTDSSSSRWAAMTRRGPRGA
ncbi:hypothetical protein BZL29_7259 [Mycobacterium kansasii]|uniref:Uncharacterized protein n=1 Tax=Mycobacterium kansasii TaxID=1768 RepID=A0A1V3WJW3_MYCKA|nr:hypothetical protein BZL29_7259 [Mycobacterium kansasii]